MLSINLFKPHQARINFGFGIVFDNGASTNQGSYKGRIIDANGEQVGDVVNNVVCIDGVKNKDDYLKGLGKNIAITAIINYNAIMKLEKGDRNIDYVVGLPPTQTVKNKSRIIANLKDEKGKSLTNIDFNHLIEKGYISENLDKTVISSKKSEKTYLDIDANKTQNEKKIILSKNCKLIVTNDMVGGISYVANVLLNDPKYKDQIKEGTSFLYIATGGGMGVAFAEFEKNDKVKIKATESGHTRDPNTGTSIESAGTSLPALIRNFAMQLGLNDDDVRKVVSTRNGKIVTDYETAKMHQLATNASDLEYDNYFEASNAAVDLYIDTIAYYCQIKVLEGVNFVVLAGPVVDGIKKYTNGNFDEILTERILEKLADDRGKAQFKDNKFRVISDIRVPDNSLGGRFLPKGEFIGEEVRGNWFEISRNDLENKPQSNLAKTFIYSIFSFLKR